MQMIVNCILLICKVTKNAYETDAYAATANF